MDSKTTATEGFSAFDEAEINGSIPARLARIVAAYPTYPAVITGDEILTYADLGERSEHVAAALLSQLGEGSEAVGLLVTGGNACVVALLGTIKSGKYYCALNPDDPPDRLQKMLVNLHARLLVANRETLDLARQIVPPGCPVMSLEVLESPLTSKYPELAIEPTRRAGIYYTSGTTGEPKGIPRDHRGLLYRAWLDNHMLNVQPGQRIIMLRRFMFAGSSGDIFGALLNGAVLCPYDVKKLGISTLPQYLADTEITIFRPPIEFLRYFLDNVEAQAIFPKIKWIVLSGDVLYRRDVARLRKHISQNARILYQLTTSETGVLTRWVITAGTLIDSEIVPVGYPVPGREILILGEDGKKLGADQVGDIGVRIRLLTPDTQLPDFMEQQFAPDPEKPGQKIFLTGDLGRVRPDGLLEFVGRRDFQVKIRGYRVNPSSVVSKLMELEGVQQAVVTARPDPAGEKRLVAYLVPAPGIRLTVESVRSHLQFSLPDYLQPSVYLMVDKIPASANGKVDIHGLPEPEWIHPSIDSESLAPRNEIERRLVILWQEVLGVERVGIQDDFFALGGHSLTGVELCAKIERDFGRTFPPAALIENNTVERLAQLLMTDMQVPKTIIPIQTGGRGVPLFVVPGNEGDALYFRPLAAHLGNDQTVYGLQLTDLGKVLPPMADLEKMAAYFLREMRTIQASGPYYLAGHSFGGRLAFAIAQQLLQAGERVDLLALLDTYAPSQTQKATLLERVGLHLNNLRALPSREWPAYFGTRWNNAIVRLSKYGLMRPLIRCFHVIPRDLASQNRIAARGYQYPYYPGKLALFRVHDRPFYVHTDLTARWRNYAAEVEFHDVPGNHVTMVNEPNVVVLADELRKCLETVRLAYSTKTKADDIH
jgi:acyl-coenzyme A synthetase/AMP-(fatty) acid ligase/thioesterase domain-containing protein/acyl carrier protein